MIRAALLFTASGLVLGLAASLFSGPAAAQQGEAAMLKRPAELRDAPADTGRSLAALPAQEALTRMGGREGARISLTALSATRG